MTITLTDSERARLREFFRAHIERATTAPPATPLKPGTGGPAATIEQHHASWLLGKAASVNETLKASGRKPW